MVNYPDPMVCMQVCPLYRDAWKADLQFRWIMDLVHDVSLPADQRNPRLG